MRQGLSGLRRSIAEADEPQEMDVLFQKEKCIREMDFGGVKIILWTPLGWWTRSGLWHWLKPAMRIKEIVEHMEM